jgi:hypothetical protein
MRVLVVLLAGLLLSGCNLVTSDEPLFGPADFASGPSLKPGLWRWRDCDRSPTDDAASDCEGGVLVGADGRLRIDDKTQVDIIGGSPMIIQTVQLEGGEGSVSYVWAQAEAWDEQGLLTALRFAPVECGPPPPNGSGAKRGEWVTRHPTKGLTIRDNDCVARDADTVRRAAAETFRRVRRDAAVVEWYAEAPTAPRAPEAADHRR